jgi:hypothetical protein
MARIALSACIVAALAYASWRLALLVEALTRRTLLGEFPFLAEFTAIILFLSLAEIALSHIGRRLGADHEQGRGEK